MIPQPSTTVHHTLDDETYLYLYEIERRYQYKGWEVSVGQQHINASSRMRVGPLSFLDTDEAIQKIETNQSDLFVLTTSGRLFHCAITRKINGICRLNHFEIKSLKDSKDDDLIVDVSCGSEHTIILTKNGKAYAKGVSNFASLLLCERMCQYPSYTYEYHYTWASCNNPQKTNQYGQLGMNDLCPRTNFTLIPFFEKFCSKVRSSRYRTLVDYPIEVVCGSLFTVFKMKSGTIYSCGSNFYGQIDPSQSKNAYVMKPTRITHFEKKALKVDAVYCGSSYTVFSVQGKLYKFGTDAKAIDNITLASPFDNIEKVFCGRSNTVLISKFNNMIINDTQSHLEIPFQKDSTCTYDPIRGFFPNIMGEYLFNRRGIIELTNPDKAYLSVDKDVQFFGKFSEYLGFVSLKYMAPTSFRKEYNLIDSLLEKTKKFKSSTDVIKVGNGEVIAFLPFIKKKYIPLYELLHKSNLHVSEHSTRIIQNLVDYCFTENTSFISDYNYEMILEIVYFLELTLFSHDFFTVHLLFAIRNQLSNIYDIENYGRDKEKQSKYVKLLLDQNIYGSVLPAMTAIMIPDPVNRADTKYLKRNDIQAIQDLYNNVETSDIILVLDRKWMKKIHCHKTLLASQSMFFEAYFNGQFSVSKEINVFTDQEDPVLEDDYEDEEESNIKTRSLEKVFMMFYGIQPEVENELVISTLDCAHKYSCERIVSECVNLFERSLNEESFEMVKNWLDSIDSSERTDVQNLLLATTTKWDSKQSSKHFAFNNKELREKMKPFIENFGGFVDDKFNPDTTTHYICSGSPSLDDLGFIAAVVGNCSLLMDSYITSCVECGQFLEEDPYIVKTPLDEKVAQLLALNDRNRKSGEKMFASLRFHLVFNSTIKKRRWERILKSGGGQIAEDDDSNRLDFYATHIVCDSKMKRKTKLRDAVKFKMQTPIVVDCKDMIDVILTGDWESYSCHDLLRESEKKKSKGSEEEED
ncbi:hypothetical protein FDP41_005582 [Naegleria fowleri]|uniref:BTB domain-containing protein n=2 Tax=Naegleria fowleri TaxID=5763 RepID=A0A6A5BN62_NAEFO|nr:uncharacterized protein FDP41_005582 [Naegleria fowleri]KAF0975588.1 hypothetical protein FDP41_005582 [Naegleria fowleri]CAG4710076.1 unnamed protein product [Naegleria fowleri]